MARARRLGLVAGLAWTLLAGPASAADDEDCDDGELVACEGDGCSDDEDWVRRCGSDDCYCRERPGAVWSSMGEGKTENLSTTAVVGGTIAGLGALAQILVGFVIVVSHGLDAESTDHLRTWYGVGFMASGLATGALGIGLASVGSRQVPVEVSVGPGSAGVTLRF